MSSKQSPTQIDVGWDIGIYYKYSRSDKDNSEQKWGGYPDYIRKVPYISILCLLPVLSYTYFIIIDFYTISMHISRFQNRFY